MSVLFGHLPPARGASLRTQSVSLGASYSEHFSQARSV